MKKNKKNLPKHISYWLKVVMLGLVLGFTLQFVRAWTEPSQAPPGGNVGAPVNTGFLGQYKIGGLMLNTGDATHAPAANGLLVSNGNVGIGTGSPLAKLAVVTTDSTAYSGLNIDAGHNMIELWNIGAADRTTDKYASIAWRSGHGNINAAIAGVYTDVTANKVDIAFLTFPWEGHVEQNVGEVERMRITSKGNVGIGTASPTSKLYVNGTFTATGSKNFEIDHPTKEGYKLVHASLEGPEAAVYYRGETKLTAGEKEVELPDYFEALTKKENRTVQLTPKGSEPYLLSAGEISGGKFKVFGTKPDGEFYWEVKAVRADIPALEVEKKK